MREREEIARKKEVQADRQLRLFQENVEFLEKKQRDKILRNASELQYVKELDQKQAADAAKREGESKRIHDKAHCENKAFLVSQV